MDLINADNFLEISDKLLEDTEFRYDDIAQFWFIMRSANIELDFSKIIPNYSNYIELIKSDNLVAAVYCQPDKPQGRSMTMTPPAVKVAAQKAGIMVYQPTTLRDGQALEQLKEIREYAAEHYGGNEALHLETITDTEMHFELFEFDC
jgi:hypothetical protein